MLRLVLLVIVVVLHAEAAELELRDGRVVEGEILPASTDAEIHLRQTIGSASITVYIARGDVVEVRTGPSAREIALADLEERVAGAQTPEQLWAVAQELRELGEHIRYRQVASSVLELDRHHEAANAALGFRKHNGVWMAPHEVAVSQGLVYVEGRWLDWASFLEVQREEEARLARRAERELEREERQAERAWRAAQRQAQSGSFVLGGLGSSGWRYDSGGSCRPYDHYFRRSTGTVIVPRGQRPPPVINLNPPDVVPDP